MKRLFILSMLSFFLVSCSANQKKVSKSYLSDVEAGSILRINRPLTVPAGEVRASLQFSKQLRTPGETNKWEPYCQMVVNTIDKLDKEIPAIDFRIRRVVRDQEPFTRTNNTKRTMIASAGDDLLFLSGPAFTSWLVKTYLYLESDQYPDIYRLVCGEAWDGYLTRRMYMDEFKGAVGTYMTILPVGT
ncbi:MAG: hypothetical protein U9N50_11060 [Pseudomonadota bacterium]|nr:hypothetical protein [Pseudomonadota bacterium]